jgi:hypothetical protein
LEQLRQLTRLRTLTVGDTGVTEAGAKKLAEALPQCKIEWGDGKVIEPGKK